VGYLNQRISRHTALLVNLQIATTGKASSIHLHAQRVSTLPTAVVAAEAGTALASETPVPSPASDNALTAQPISTKTRCY